MNVTLKSLLMAVGCFSLASTLCSSTHADETTNNIPAIKASWTPSFGLGYVTLSITNQNTYPIAVSKSLDFHYIKMGELQPKSDQLSPLFLQHGVVIRTTVLFMATPGDHSDLASRQGEGMEAGTFEIAPGETKDIRFSVLPFASQARNSSQATFLLSVNGKELNKVIMAHLDNIWKEQSK